MTEDVSLTDEELSKVNTIIIGIQSSLSKAINKIKSEEWDSAISYIEEGKSKSSCPLCKRELGTLQADIRHNKEICILDSNDCKKELTTLTKKAIKLKDDFVPFTTTKKAIREKKNILKSQKQFNPLDPLGLFDNLFTR